MEQYNRRQVVQGAAVAAACGLASSCGCASSGTQSQKSTTAGSAGGKGAAFTPLQEGGHIDVGSRAQEMIDKASQLGEDMMRQHGHWARCIVTAMQQAMPFVPDDPGLRRAACCVDGGATPTGTHSCGAFTGAGMFLGYVCGSADFEKVPLPRKLLRQVYQNFEKEYGSVLCRDIKPKAVGGCPKVVGLAAEWTAQALLAEFAGYGTKQS
jgi:C_GCAxxG_C_C family probable redox protein